MGGNWSFWDGSSIRIDTPLQLLTGLESYHTTRRDRNFLPGFGVATRARTLLAQGEIAKTGQFYAFTARQCIAHVLEKRLHDLARFAFVDAKLAAQHLAHLGLGQGVVLAVSPFRPVGPRPGAA